MKKITFLFALLFVVMSAFAADYYVAGTSSLCGSNWSNNDANNKMTLTNGVYVKTYANVAAGSHEFKITNGTWDNAKGISKVDASTSTPGYSGSDNISFVLTEATTITISYNESTDKITLKADGIDRFGAFSVSSYTLCGDFPCFNGDWAPGNTSNDMTKGTDGIWTKSYENVNLDARTYEYKVAANHNWGQGEFPTSGNNNYEIKEAGVYNITFSYNPSKPELICNAVSVGGVERLTYPTGMTIYVTVHTQWLADNARFAAYFFGVGEIWQNMTAVETGVYSVAVPAGEWTGMIVCRMNPNNTENSWNNEGENAPYWGAQTQDIFYEDGQNHYIINSNDPTWDGAKPSGSWTTYGGNLGQDPGDDDKPNVDPNASSYTLCGDQVIFGSDWDETDTNNDMTKGEDGVWTKEYENIVLAKGSYEYKVVANHAWDVAGQYPADNSNMTIYISKDGTYNLSFFYNPMSPELKCTYTRLIPVGVEDILVDQVYTVGNKIYANTDIRIYSVTGKEVTSCNGNLECGIYIVKSANAITKVIIK